MKWVFLVILACIIPYTVITIKYRKETPAFEPYADSKERANAMRLLDAGYQRIKVSAVRPADPQLLFSTLTRPAIVTDVAAGLTEGLAATLVEIPQLPLSFGAVTASSETTSLQPYVIVFTYKLADQKHQLGGAEVFLRGGSVEIVAQHERLSGELTARSKESTVVITLPGGALKNGRYTFHLAGSQHSRQWQVEVR
jgi:hypothetical protein